MISSPERISRIRFAVIFPCVLALLAPRGGFAGGLSMSEAVDLALEADPLVGRFERMAEAKTEMSVAEGQLPDPKLRFAFANYPWDTLNRGDEPMTQLVVGVQQAFPRGRTLDYRQKATLSLAESERAAAAEQARKVSREVRLTWLEIYLQRRTGEIIEDSRALFTKLLNITEAHYATGRASQQDVMRAQLELSRLEERRSRAREKEDDARSELAQWIGDSAWRPVAGDFPEFPPLPPREILEAALTEHPLIRSQEAKIRAGQHTVSVAREQYKPGLAVDLSYGGRKDRTDFVSAMLVMDLPLFPDKRQDRQLAARQAELEASKLERSDRLRTLRRMVQKDYALLENLGERERLFRDRLLREARLHAETSLNAYQSGVGEFNALMRARITELEVRLDALQLQVSHAKARARLSYVAGGVE